MNTNERHELVADACSPKRGRGGFRLGAGRKPGAGRSSMADRIAAAEQSIQRLEQHLGLPALDRATAAPSNSTRLTSLERRVAVLELLVAKRT